MPAGGEYELAATVTAVSFTDRNALVSAQKYSYKVVALDDFGNVSAFSSAVYTVTPNN